MDEEGESTGYGSSPRRLRACLFASAKRARKEGAASSSPAWPAGYRHRSRSKVYRCLLTGRAPAKRHTLRRSHMLFRVSSLSFRCNMWPRPRRTVGHFPWVSRACRQPAQKALSCATPNQPSSGRKGDRLRWKEPAGDFVANSHYVIPAFPANVEEASGRFCSK